MNSLTPGNRIALSFFFVWVLFENNTHVAAYETSVPMKLLNQRGNALSPGNIYVIGPGSVTSVVELLEKRPLGETGGWFEYSEGDCARIFVQYREHTFVNGRRCIQLRRVTLEAREVIAVRLGDPFECLEIVNRPISGLDYNREAESRIMQWRESIASALRHSSNGSMNKVVLCTGVDLITHGELTSRAQHAPQNMKPQAMISAAHGLFDSTDIQVDWTQRYLEGSVLHVPLRGEIVARAQLRQIESVDASTSPRIEFTLGPTYNLHSSLSSTKGVSTSSQVFNLKR